MELHFSWKAFPSQAVGQPNSGRVSQAYVSSAHARGMNESVLLFGGCAHSQCHDDLRVVTQESDTLRWKFPHATSFGLSGSPSPRHSALLVARSRWAWLLGGTPYDEGVASSTEEHSLDAMEVRPAHRSLSIDMRVNVCVSLVFAAIGLQA